MHLQYVPNRRRYEQYNYQMIAKLMHELTLEKSLGSVIFSFRFAALHGL